MATQLNTLNRPPNHLFKTRSLIFSSVLLTLGYQLIDTSVSTSGDVTFIFATKGEDLQELYEQYNIRDIPVPARQFSGHWRRLRRLINTVRQ
jgi:hypothetical protein